MRLRSEVKEWFGDSPSLPVSGRVHFIGIGGAGMSALARILLHRGREVTGSDASDSAVLGDLRELGARVFNGHSPEYAREAAAVVISDAIELESNEEALAARQCGAVLLRRSQLLGWLVRDKRVLAVTGSHGKSTVTALIAQILRTAGCDPLAVVGADVPTFHGNVLLGNGEIAVVEACEAYDGFHDIAPHHVILTNLEPEHLDYHGDWEHLLGSVTRFAQSAGEMPRLVYCADDEGASTVAEHVQGTRSYGIASGDLRGAYSDGALHVGGVEAALHLPGKHNAYNALAAACAAEIVGIPLETAIGALAQAVGCKRRLENFGEVNGIVVYDDYAHHPAEIRASLSAMRETHSGARIVLVYQPHLYSRTRELAADFVEALSGADAVFLTDIYPAREKPLPGVSSAVLMEALEVRQVLSQYVPSRHLLPSAVAAAAMPGDVVVGMGAGDIEGFAPAFVGELSRAGRPLSVAVFCGGDSAEREVSLLSGHMVADALRGRGYDCKTFDPADMLLGLGDVTPLLGPLRPDIVFIAMHGTGAEDGAIQGFLESMHLPYTGSGIHQSALAMDKHATKQLLRAAGIPVPDGFLVRKGEAIPQAEFPVAVKPNRQGSTIGLRFAHGRPALESAVSIALKYDECALVEKLIEGVEISVPVLDEQVLPAVEIIPRGGFYGFSAKYTPGETEEIAPARISNEEAEIAADYALRTHGLVGARDFSRTDMIVANGRIVVLEINTIPGLTQTSLLPKSAESIGISFDEVCEIVLRSALRRYGIEKRAT